MKHETAFKYIDVPVTDGNGIIGSYAEAKESVSEAFTLNQYDFFEPSVSYYTEAVREVSKESILDQALDSFHHFFDIFF